LLRARPRSFQVTPDIPDRRRATQQKEVRPAGPTASKGVSSPPVGTFSSAPDITDAGITTASLDAIARLRPGRGHAAPPLVVRGASTRLVGCRRGTTTLVGKGHSRAGRLQLVHLDTLARDAWRARVRGGATARAFAGDQRGAGRAITSWWSTPWPGCINSGHVLSVDPVIASRLKA
jgi:hypothetical protein